MLIVMCSLHNKTKADAILSGLRRYKNIVVGPGTMVLPDLDDPRVAKREIDDRVSPGDEVFIMPVANDDCITVAPPVTKH